MRSLVSPLRTAVAALALVAGCGALAARTPPPAADAGRPVVLLLHGRGLLGRDSAAVRQEWRRALEAGARPAAGDSLLRPDDVRLVWYADALDPLSEEGCEYHARNPRSRALWQQRGELQTLVGLTRLVLASALDGAAEADQLQLRALLSDLLYLGDLWKRCGAERRLAAALDRAAREGRPVVLVAYSLGSLVAYSYLHGYEPPAGAPPVAVFRLVTIGSTLGSPDVRELLLGAPAARVSPPAPVGSWVNVRDRGDPFAPALAGDGIAEVVLDRGGDAVNAHDVLRYLRDPVAARTIVSAWCDAFGAGAAGSAPAGCDGVTPGSRLH